MSVAALVLGIVAVVVAFVPFLNFITWIPAVLALVFGIIGLVRKGGGSKVLPTVGTVLGGIGLVLGIIMPIAYAAAFVSAVDNAIDEGTGIVDVPAGEDEDSSDDAASDLGTRENPVPIGTTIELGNFGETSWEVTPGAPTLDANALIAAENQFNSAPAVGSQYVMLPLDVTYVGSESGTPWIDLSVSFVGSDGITYDQSFVVQPSPLTDVGEMFKGANAQGNVVVEIPADVIEGGTWSISLLFGDPIYFASH
jgi:hypothetical protein